MVTAGVYLLIRFQAIFTHILSFYSILAILGLLTAFVSALTAMCQQDLKKIIAYSTCSQLGYMILACGLLQFTTGFYHLINHAFFKALLFLAAGSVIHALDD